ncbi:MAG: type II toxin-antitoxin system HicA family toxin [Selenomonadaceae bacterium]|nr:type II toxin-antitoxin system HicA family toxin [Selenomonadaceae bacterium]
MKRRDLLKRLKNGGWYFLRNGANHDVYTDGTHMEPIPRHNDIDEDLARHILKKYGLWR